MALPQLSSTMNKSLNRALSKPVSSEEKKTRPHRVPELENNYSFFEIDYEKFADEYSKPFTVNDLYFDPSVEALFADDTANGEVANHEGKGGISEFEKLGGTFVHDRSSSGVLQYGDPLAATLSSASLPLQVEEVTAVVERCNSCNFLAKQVNAGASADLPSLLRTLVKNHKKFLLMQSTVLQAIERSGLKQALDTPELSRPLLRKEYSALARALAELSLPAKETHSKQTQTCVSLAPDSSQWRVDVAGRGKRLKKTRLVDAEVDTSDLYTTFHPSLSFFPNVKPLARRKRLR